MKECENCDYSDIADWEQDKKTGKATPIYWCERNKESCSDIKECQHISGNEGDRLYIKIYADMEPGDIAEKVYCICNEEKLPEVVDILSEIVRDNCGEVNK